MSAEEAKQRERTRLLDEWKRRLNVACIRGGIVIKHRIERVTIRAVNGPRAGSLEIMAGRHAPALLRALGEGNCAWTRQSIPWKDFTGNPSAFVRGAAIRIEAGWPEALATTEIRLADIGGKPDGGGRWVAGQGERGETIIGELSDQVPHWLIGGQTGSGKSVAMRTAGIQLARDPKNQIVLVDGKFGDGLGVLAGTATVAGPIATDVSSARRALGWAWSRMCDRYKSGQVEEGKKDDAFGRIVVLFDEFQNFAADLLVAELMRRIASQGRTAGVHEILATQHPLNSVVRDSTTKRNLPGRLALRVTDFAASRVVVGGERPRADHLLGGGDSYCQEIRIQGALTGPADVSALKSDIGVHEPKDWPEFSAEDLGQDIEGQPTSRRREPCAEEIANAILAAAGGQGRPAFRARFDNPPGAGRAKWLIDFGRNVWERVKDAPEIRERAVISPDLLAAIAPLCRLVEGKGA